MTDEPSNPPRRRFLAGSAGAVAAGLGARALLAQGRSYPEYPPPQGGWDLSWVPRVERATHRAVFDMAELGDGLALTNVVLYLRGFAEAYATKDTDMGVVIVVRHRATR